MIKFFRFSPSRLALVYIALSVFVLALFAIPLWYAWRVNLSTFKAYVQGEDLQRLVDIFHREGAQGLATAMESRVRNLPGDEVIVFADASKLRLAGNLTVWPTEVPDAPGTYGLVIGLGGGSTMRVVAAHVRLPGGYHLLMGRESVRFESLVERFWYGITGAMVIVVVLGAVIGWLSHRALLSEVNEISRTASAIVEGDLSRRVATRGGSDELDTLARTVNGMLEQLARQNVQLESEIAVRRQAQQALHRAHEDLEGLVAERTVQLARANESLRRSEAYLAVAQRLSHTGSWAFASPPERSSTGRRNTSAYSASIRNRGCRHSKRFYSKFIPTIESGPLKSSREQFARGRTTNWIGESFFRTAR
jgi:HAMP domain-containing protein